MSNLTQATAQTADPRHLPLDLIMPSAANPRRSHHAAADLELLESIRQHGVLTPLLVTPIRMHDIDAGPDLYELIAGHRRFAAARELGLETVPVILRDGLSDDQRRALSIVENLQRKDLDPLDEAAGFRALLNFSGSGETPAGLAKRVGKPERHVWDTLKLLDLVPDAQRLLSDGILPLPHAQILAKLSPADQQRALDPDSHRGGAVFTGDSGFDFEGTGKPGKWEGLKPVSARELQRWVQDHVRFNPVHAAQADPLVFTETAKVVDAAQAQPGRGVKVVQITYDGFVQPDARDEDGARTYTYKSWRRADGAEKSKPCAASVIGYVVVGPRQGESFPVCVKKGCPVHWPEEKKAAAKKGSAGQVKHAGNDESAYRRQQKQRAREERAWKLVYPRVLDVLIEASARVKTTDAHLKDALGLVGARGKAVLNVVGSVTYKTFGRAFVLDRAQRVVSPHWFAERAVSLALKGAGSRFDIKKAMKAALAQIEQPATTPGKDAKTKPAFPSPGGPGVCRACGCTAEATCYDDHDQACAWADGTLTICSACVQAGKGEANNPAQRAATKSITEARSAITKARAAAKKPAPKAKARRTS